MTKKQQKTKVLGNLNEEIKRFSEISNSNLGLIPSIGVLNLIGIKKKEENLKRSLLKERVSSG